MSTLLRRGKSKKNRKPADPETTDPETTEADATEATDDAPDQPEAAGPEATTEDTGAADATAADDADDTADDTADDEDSDEDAEEDDAFAFEDDDDLDDGDEEPVTPRNRTRAARQILVVLALVALVLSGAVFYLLHRLNDARAADEAGDAAVAAAREHAQDLLSYDYRDLDNDFSRGLAATTGGFRTQYKQTTTQLVKPRAAQQKVIVQAAVMNAGLVSATDDNAVVLVFVDRVTTKAGQKKPAFDQDRVRMSMTKVNGKWLVSKLDAL